MKNRYLYEEEREGYEAFLNGVDKGDNPYMFDDFGDYIENFEGKKAAEQGWFDGWEIACAEEKKREMTIDLLGE